jgi:uncharacterized membrane protein YphA (DoxX/SURF4 family)
MLAVDVHDSSPAVRWRPTTRIAFRFVALYFGLYILTTQMLGSLIVLPVGNVPDLQELPPVRTVVSWVATHVFRVTTPLVISGSGSGDKTFDWVHAFCVLAIAVAGTAIWSWIDRRRLSYGAIDQWFRLFARVALGSTMVSYGFAKVIPVQMPYPSLTRLVEPYGNFSPMGALWYFIGASPAYETLVGCAELAGGVLLFIPRTATLGALICLADTIQIFALNMTYDVPVKLFSFHLIALAAILLAPDAERLLNVLVLNRTAYPSPQPPLGRSARQVRIGVAAQILFGLYVVVVNLYGARQAWTQYGGGAPKSPLYGIWNVDQMTIDGQIRSPLVTDFDRWRRVVFDRPTMVAFQRMNDSFVIFGVRVDTNANGLALSKGNDSAWTAPFSFQRPAGNRLILDGRMDGRDVRLEMTLVDRNTFLLVNRGFHWIQEYPFNR